MNVLQFFTIRYLIQHFGWVPVVGVVTLLAITAVMSIVLLRRKAPAAGALEQGPRVGERTADVAPVPVG